MEWNKIVEFKGRNLSSAENLNFLYRSGNIFVMDNHLAALWCWMQFPLSNEFKFLHIDAHWDCLEMITAEIWDGLNKPIGEMTIEEYTNTLHPNEEIMPGEGMKLFRWDNYIPPFLAEFEDLISKKYAACHGVGTPGKFDENFDPYNILAALENNFDIPDPAPWIINIDFDYFFTHQVRTQLFSDYLIKEIARQVNGLISDNKLICCTLALSPECCGGWEESERVAKLFIEELGLPFELPKI